MQQMIKRLMIIAGLVMALSPTAVVYARGGDGSGSRDGNTITSSGENETEAEQQKDLTEKQTELAKRQAEMQAEAQKKMAERAKELENEGKKEDKRTPEERKKTCEERKAGLEQKLTNIKKNAQKHQDKITSYLDKAVKYKDDNNVTDADVAAAILKASEAKAASAASIAALQTLSPSVDCASGAVASDVATFKAAAEQARDNLKAYRSSVKGVYEALEKVRESTSNDSGAQQQ